MVSKCKQMKTEYTGNNYNLSRHFNPSYLVSNVNICRSTVNLAFSRLASKITRIQKIQQGTKNEGKWKEARQRKKNNG